MNPAASSDAHPHGTRPRRIAPWRALAGLALLVLIAHLLLTSAVLDEMQDAKPDAPGIQRMEAAYVSEVRLTQPPTSAAAPVAPPPPAAPPAMRKPKGVKPPKAASAPQEAASSADAASMAQAASAPQDSASAAAMAASQAETAATASASASAAASSSMAAAPPASVASEPAPPAFVWPLATRVSYQLEGFFRGPVYGQASVEWVRKESRYQVHVDASVGPSFAPLGSWRLTSEGEIQPRGLHPQRYESVDRLLIKTSKPRLMKLDEDLVTQPDGKQFARPPDIQDPASFMIQVAYQFILHPERTRPGASFEMTVLTLKKAEPLVFDVVEEVPLETPMGRIPTLHVKPRKAVTDGGALPAEVWFAPGLQYLPVRIYVKRNDDSFMDMRLDRAPQQTPGTPVNGKPGAAAASPSASVASGPAR